MEAEALKQGRFSVGAGFEEMSSCSLIRNPIFLGDVEIKATALCGSVSPSRRYLHGKV
jgi:hypothetical protein